MFSNLPSRFSELSTSIMFKGLKLLSRNIKWNLYHAKWMHGMFYPCTFLIKVEIELETVSHPFFKSCMYSSMTSLFAHKVAQPTKWRCLPKNLSQLKWVHPIIFASNVFHNSHLNQKCIQNQHFCIHFWIKWELWKTFDAMMIG